MVARMASALIVLAALCAGTLLGAYMLKPKLGPYPNYEPEVELEYLYIRIFNTTVAINGVGPQNATMASFMAVIKVGNPYNNTDILPSTVAIHVPQDVDYEESNASTVTFTATISIKEKGSQVPSGGSPPNDSVEIIKSGDGFAYGFTNDLILDHGVVRFSLRDISSVIPRNSDAYVMISGTVPLPELWGKNVRTWFHGGSWAYVVISIDGKALGNNLEVKGTSDYVLILKVRLTHEGNEYWYGSIPKVVLDNPTDILVIIPKGVTT